MNDARFSRTVASRRGFLGVAGGALAGSGLTGSAAAADEPPAAGVPAGGVHVSGSDEIHAALVGCGGRGGSAIVDAKGRRSYATSAGSSPSVGKHVLLAYLPPEHAVEGRRLYVRYFDESYPVTVAVVGSRPLFDPENLRVRA